MIFRGNVLAGSPGVYHLGLLDNIKRGSDSERNQQNLTKEHSLLGFFVTLVTEMKDAKGV